MTNLVWPSGLPQRPSIGGYQERFAETALRTPKVVLADQPDTIEVEYAGMRLRNVTWDQGEISGDLVYEDILSEPVCEQMTPARFPGAF